MTENVNRQCANCMHKFNLGPDTRKDSICWNCARGSEWTAMPIKVEAVYTSPNQILRDRGVALDKKMDEHKAACCETCKYADANQWDLPCRECYTFNKWLPEECRTLSEVGDLSPEFDGPSGYFHGPGLPKAIKYGEEDIMEKDIQEVLAGKTSGETVELETTLLQGEFIDPDDPESNDKVSDILPDSGQRRQFSTGSVRDIRVNKGRYDLMSPFALFRYARRMEDGATKYGHRNWEKGQELMSYLDSALRHIFKYIWLCMTGQPVDEDHIGAAMWNISSFIHTQEMIRLGKLPAELDDIPGGGQYYEDKEPTETEEA